MKNDSLLGFALMGLLHEEPRSGYDLRKVFATTAMGSFSDSPGAIYPALERLAKREMVRGTVEAGSGLRRRRVFRLTAKGSAALKAWLKKPVSQDDVMRRVGDLMLRFAFMEEVLGAERAAGFLDEFAREIELYLPSLREFLKVHGDEMTRSGRLALECGVQEYEVRATWAREAKMAFEERKR